MPRALQIPGTATPLASSASASRSLRMICLGEWRMRFIESPPALSGENDSHTRWTSLGGAGHVDLRLGQVVVTGDVALVPGPGEAGRRLDQFLLPSPGED